MLTSIKKIKIGLDFDDTYTEDPELWAIFVNSAILRGHEVKFVTFRGELGDNKDILTAAQGLGIGVIFTGGMQKCNFYDADLWVDDMPITIPNVVDLLGMYDSCITMGDTDVSA